MLETARRGLRLSKRAAADKAGFSEITWRQLEAGERQIAKGIKLPVSPRDDTLESAALAVGLNPVDVFAAAGREYDGPRLVRSPQVITGVGVTEIALHAKIDRLTERDREAIEAAVDRLLGED